MSGKAVGMAGLGLGQITMEIIVPGTAVTSIAQIGHLLFGGGVVVFKVLLTLLILNGALIQPPVVIAKLHYSALSNSK